MSWHCLLATTVGTFSTPPWSWARIGVPHVPEQLSHGCLLTPLMAQPPATVGHASWNLLQLRPARLQPARPRMIQREGRSCLACSLLPVAPPEPVTPLQSMAHDSNCKALQGSARLCKALQGSARLCKAARSKVRRGCSLCRPASTAKAEEHAWSACGAARAGAALITSARRDSSLGKLCIGKAFLLELHRG